MLETTLYILKTENIVVVVVSSVVVVVCLIPFTVFPLFYFLTFLGGTHMLQHDMNSSAWAAGSNYPVFTFVNVRDNSVYTENRKYSSSSS